MNIDTNHLRTLRNNNNTGAALAYLLTLLTGPKAERLREILSWFEGYLSARGYLPQDLYEMRYFEVYNPLMGLVRDQLGAGVHKRVYAVM